VGQPSRIEFEFGRRDSKPRWASVSTHGALDGPEQHQNAKPIGASVAFDEIDTVPEMPQTARLMLAQKAPAIARGFF
jgi:hypothetical protein